ncbi:hypothetical protein Ddc_00146 [Ditylenchus destructor]|nr:hypothetical protein Ddc_00146 [Ditylenchus destructor]
MRVVSQARRLFCAGQYLRLRYTTLFLLFLSIVLTLILIEENAYHGGFLSNFYGNYYNEIVYLEITKRRPEADKGNGTNGTRINIAIVVILNHTNDYDQYPIAQRTLQCYAQLFDYPLIVISLDQNKEEPTVITNDSVMSPDFEWRKKCNQKDFMFRRHCVLAQLLRQTSELEYVVFLDADVGVINPNHLLEEYISESGADLIFYERIFNYEVMAGSYIVRRSNYSINFLEAWADYSEKLPDSFHGSDNGAIHAVLLDVVCANCSQARKDLCLNKLWPASKNYDDLSVFTSCARAILGHRSRLGDHNEILILTNPTKYWARDGWLTGNQWAPQEFMFHGWQQRRMDRVIFASWNSPLREQEFMAHSNCRFPDEFSPSQTKEVHMNWPYKNTFMRSNEFIESRLFSISKKTHLQHLANLRKIDMNLVRNI